MHFGNVPTTCSKLSTLARTPTYSLKLYDDNLMKTFSHCFSYVRAEKKFFLQSLTMVAQILISEMANEEQACGDQLDSNAPLIPRSAT